MTYSPELAKEVEELKEAEIFMNQELKPGDMVSADFLRDGMEFIYVGTPGKIEIGDQPDGPFFGLELDALLLTKVEHPLFGALLSFACVPTKMLSRTGDNNKAMMDALALFNEEHEFKVGDVVTYKHGFNLGSFPQVDAPAIIVEILDEPLYVSSGYREQGLSPNLRCKSKNENGEVVTFMYDSRLMMPLAE